MRKATSTSTFVVAAAVAVAFNPSAQAADLGRPSGKWLEAIVAHEVGHCLGWWEHRVPTAKSVMRTSLNPYRINKGYDTYVPQYYNDIMSMKASRANTVAGETQTYYVQYPFVQDALRVHDKTGVSNTMTAVNRWRIAGFTTTKTTVTPNITIFWDKNLSGKSIGGQISVNRWEWNGKFYQIASCNVHLNPRVVTK